MWCPLLPSVTEEKARVGKKSVDKFSRRTRTAQPPSLPRKEATLSTMELFGTMNTPRTTCTHPPPFSIQTASVLLSTSAELRTHDIAFTSIAI